MAEEMAATAGQKQFQLYLAFKELETLEVKGHVTGRTEGLPKEVLRQRQADADYKAKKKLRRQGQAMLIWQDEDEYAEYAAAIEGMFSLSPSRNVAEDAAAIEEMFSL